MELTLLAAHLLTLGPFSIPTEWTEWLFRFNRRRPQDGFMHQFYVDIYARKALPAVIPSVWFANEMVDSLIVSLNNF